jgi:hypothetical protein
MAVLVEGISLVTKRSSITRIYPGGWERFLAIVPNETLCFDVDLARVGFMSPAEVERFVFQLADSGLRSIADGSAVDMAVVDQLRGTTANAHWLEYARLPLGKTGNAVAACWLFEGQRIAPRMPHITDSALAIATPEGWLYEDSLSSNFKFIEDDDLKSAMVFVRSDGDLDVYLARATGKEYFTSKHRH